MSEWLKLKDKTAIVTVGASGIGHAVACSLRDAGIGANIQNTRLMKKI